MAEKENYFNAFIELIDFSCELAEQLKIILNDFHPEQIGSKMEDLHKIEHSADVRKHEMMSRLADEFIVPIEREDIISLSQSIDDITDSIEDILLKIYMFRIKEITEEALLFADIITRCCYDLKQILIEFPNFHKSKKIKQYVVAINTSEEEGDALFTKANYNLYGSDDIKKILVWSEVYKKMEKCCDSCEKTANLVEGIIMKNS